MGLLILYQPRFASEHNSAIPPWMDRFSRIGHLKRTILILVAVIFSIGLLERFVAVKTEDLQEHALPLLLYSAVGVGMLIGLALFLRLSLHDE